MKILWPWRRSKPLSLFENRIPRTEVSAGGLRISSTLTPDQPHRMNAPGPFYVVNQECMTCGYPPCARPGPDGMGEGFGRTCMSLLFQETAGVISGNRASGKRHQRKLLWRASLFRFGPRDHQTYFMTAKE